MIYLPLAQSAAITFVMIDSAGVEVTGLGSGFTLEISKAGGVFASSTGVKAEISDGWYAYTLTASETDTIGPLSLHVNGAGALQQNLLYFIKSASVNAIEFTYTLTEPPEGVGAPITGATVWITSDIAGMNIVWNGTTDGLGVARDNQGEKPWLDPGTYYFWRQKYGYTFTDPDTEVVS